MTVQELVQEVTAAPVEKRAITNLHVLNEAYDYAKPSSFSRGMRIDLNGLVVLLISGTASIDENGATLHVGHPLMRSIEPGESWLWCYIDQMEPGELDA